MSSPFDINRFPDLPPEVLKAFEAQQAALEASRMETIIERAARLHQEAVVSEKEGLAEYERRGISRRERALRRLACERIEAERRRRRG